MGYRRDGTASQPSLRTLGTGSTQAAAGNHTHSSLNIGCRLTRTGSGFSIANTSHDAVEFNSEISDTSAFHDNSTNPSRITIPTGQDGRYLFGCCVEWASAGNRSVGIYKNGAYIVRDFNGSALIHGCMTEIDAVATDYFQVVCWQNSGGALNVEIDGDFSPIFWCRRIV